MSTNKKHKLSRVEITFPDCSFTPEELAYATRSLKRGNIDNKYHLCNLVKLEIKEDFEQASRSLGVKVLEKIQLVLGRDATLTKWVYYNGGSRNAVSLYNLPNLDLRKLWLYCHRKGKFKVAVTIQPLDHCEYKFLPSSIRYLE